MGLIKAALLKQASQSVCCSCLLLVGSTGLWGSFPWEQKQCQHPSGKSHSGSSQAALHCLSVEEAAGARPGAAARSTAQPWRGGRVRGPATGKGRVSRGASPLLLGLGCFGEGSLRSWLANS